MTKIIKMLFLEKRVYMLSEKKYQLRKEMLMLQDKRYEKLLEKHKDVFNELFFKNNRIIYKKIISNIERWKRDNLCTENYIIQWSQIINDQNLFKEIVLTPSHPSNRFILQNSPALGLII